MPPSTTEFFVWTTKLHVTREQARQIDEAIKRIDSSADFVRHYAPGNDTHGWIARPNDGTNGYNHVRARNAELVKIAESILIGPIRYTSVIVEHGAERGHYWFGRGATTTPEKVAKEHIEHGARCGAGLMRVRVFAGETHHTFQKKPLLDFDIDPRGKWDVATAIAQSTR